MNKLDEKKINLLTQAGFDFGNDDLKGMDVVWFRGFQRLSEYIEQYGEVPPPTAPNKLDRQSRKWLLSQMRRIKADELQDDKVQRLRNLGVLDIEFRARAPAGDKPIEPAKQSSAGWAARQDLLFDTHCNELVEYASYNDGDANIRKDGNHYSKPLYDWAVLQRRAYREGTLRHDRIERLRSIRFDLEWCAHKFKNDVKWNLMYDQLVDYYKLHGDLNVPRCYKSEQHGTLGAWVYNSRKLAADSKLDHDRMTKVRDAFLV